MIRIPDPRGAEPPWDAIDYRVRTTVRALWEAGFDPCSSTPGLPGIPAVIVMHCAPHLLIREADRLRDTVNGWVMEGRLRSVATGSVVATYAAQRGTAELRLVGVAL